MEVANTVIPNEDNDEEDLSRCSPNHGSLPAIRLGNGVWLARWTLNEAEKKMVAETGDIYIRMHALDGDELVMPHRLFAEKPNITWMKEYFGGTNQLNQNKKLEILTEEKPKNSVGDKDELRLLIQEEISKAFDVAFSAALNYPVSISDATSMEKQEARQKQNAIVREIGDAVKNALRNLKDETFARIVEKTDPERAKRIRDFKPTL